MKHLTNILFASALSTALLSCGKNDPVANEVTLRFNNTFKAETIVLGDAGSSQATVHTSTAGQTHQFAELKYVISNIRLVKSDGQEIPYHINDLDNGAIVVDQSKAPTLSYVLSDIPSGDYRQLKFGLGIKQDLNTLDQVRFPKFYAIAGANDTKMMWEWGTGYRFTKIEGFYGTDKQPLSIHTGSTVAGQADDPSTYVPGVDAYRDIVLSLPQVAIVGKESPTITITADFDKLLSGKTNTITLGKDNATPNIHTADQMVKFVDNLGGNGSSDRSGIFSISGVSN